MMMIRERERERHVTFKRKNKGKKKNEIQSLPHDAHSTWFADRLPFVVVVVFCGEEVVKALLLPPKLVGDDASFTSTHMRCAITFLFFEVFFVLVEYFLGEFN